VESGDEVAACPRCAAGATALQTTISQASDQQVEYKLLELCGQLGSYSDACMVTVTDQKEEMLRLVRELVTPDLCTAGSLCKLEAEAPVSLAAPQQEDIQCEFCEKVIKHWLDVYTSNSSLEEFRELMDGICEKLDKKNSAHCKHIVDDYYIPAFEFLRNLNPELLCSAVGLCGNTETGKMNVVPASKKVKEVVTMTKLVPARKNSMRLQPFPNVKEKPTCVLCEYVLHELQSYLQDGQTEAEIKEYVDNICLKLPKAIRPECQHFVEAYEPLIVALLVQELDPSAVCKMIKLCDDQIHLTGLSEESSLEKSSSCETCEFVLSEVFSVLQDKDDREMVRNVLESVCYRLPASIDVPCEQFVDRYTDVILDMIAKSLTADQVCSALDLCQNRDSKKAVASLDVAVEKKTFKPLRPAPRNNLGDTGCVLCEYVIANLDAMLEDKKNEAEIKAALESVCSIMPATVSKQCNQFVDTYTDLILSLLTHDITPEQICTSIGLCKKPREVVKPLAPIDMAKGPYCTLCEYAIREVDILLKDKQNEEEIKQVLDVVCYQLSAPVHKECLAMVDKYTDEIIQLLTQNYTAERVCSEIALCVNNEINTNDISALEFEPVEKEVFQSEDLGCVLCEFAMQVLDEHLDDAPTIDQVERVVQFLCSYLPGSIADRCEKFVDQYGQAVIDALVHDELSPKQVCVVALGLCKPAYRYLRPSAIPAYLPLRTTDKPAFLPLRTTDKPAFLPLRTTDKPAYLPVQSTTKPAYLPLRTTEKPAYLPLRTTDKLAYLPLRTTERTFSTLKPFRGQCAWGMEFWCTSPMHAMLCGAVQLCQETAWQNLRERN